MRIAIMSDSHDNIWHLKTALDLIAEAEAEAIIHCGDFVAPFMLRRMDKAGIPVHGVLGNNDGSVLTLARAAYRDLDHIHLHETVGKVTLGGLRIAFTHQPDVGRAFAATGDFDLVCCGHSHTWHREELGRSTLLNPGEIMGSNGDPSFALLDTTEGTIRKITFPHALGHHAQAALHLDNTRRETYTMRRC
ncbi:YfcE family phosphodiesterase [Desulfoluna butyratoxydans]|uniref:Phosphoesterase n=1 Tax=Desulfoluna butyratoxydans TaxID=231438 RepID=A0A4U8YN98_9BACT|nr:YfcE family phosphodiesterase [Desulfoluna butyratoxydans]VFQ44679.1 phosphodiesterase mj0936/vps29 [Desulfoluna butyratoxydans]